MQISHVSYAIQTNNMTLDAPLILERRLSQEGIGREVVKARTKFLLSGVIITIVALSSQFNSDLLLSMTSSLININTDVS